jgi:hypothetical protein
LVVVVARKSHFVDLTAGFAARWPSSTAEARQDWMTFRNQRMVELLSPSR